MNTTDNINYFSDKGKVFSRKSDGLIMGYGIGLGKNDSIFSIYGVNDNMKYEPVYENNILIGYDLYVD